MIITDSNNSKRGDSLVFRILLPVGILCIAVFALSRLSTTSPINDLSGGRYAETFKTTNRNLIYELTHLFRENYFKTIQLKEQSVLLNAEETQKLTGQHLEQTPQDALLFLLGAAEKAITRKDAEQTHTIVNKMYWLAIYSARSNEPDIYYLECALKTENAGRQAGLLKKIEHPSAERFPLSTYIEYERRLYMRDFEKIRLNGIHLFDGKPLPRTQLKEAVQSFSVSMFFAALWQYVCDYFYDVDRDQTSTLIMYRTELNNPSRLTRPSRKMSSRAYNRLISIKGRHSKAVEKLHFLRGEFIR